MAGDHYIQQQYLRGFSLEDKDDLVAFWHRNNGSKVGTTGTKVLCSEKDLFTTFDEGEFNNRQIDEYLTKKVEPALGSCLNKIDSNGKLSPDDKIGLSKYIVFKYYMIPSWREKHSFLSKRYLSHLKDRSEPNIWAKELFNTYTKDAKVLCKRYWKLYRAKKGTAFITSDNPVACFTSKDGQFKKGGFARLGGSLTALNSFILFPLRKDLLLQIWSSEFDNGYEAANATKSNVAVYNHYSQMNCHNYIIGSSIPLVERFAKKAIEDDRITDLQIEALNDL